MSVAVDVKTLVIDGINVSARADQTVLEVARENNIAIPTLCHLDGLSEVGACRMCLVEVKNSPKLFPSCVLKVEEGMEVTTASDRLKHYRQTIWNCSLPSATTSARYAWPMDIASCSLRHRSRA